MHGSIALILLSCFAASSAGVIESHHVVEEHVLAKVGAVIHSAPSAVSHQSFTRYHNKAVVSPVVAPVIKTTVHEAPVVSIVETAPVVSVVKSAAPLVQAYAAGPPLVHSLHAAPILNAVPDVAIVKNTPVIRSYSVPFVHNAPAAYTIHH